MRVVETWIVVFSLMVIGRLAGKESVVTSTRRVFGLDWRVVPRSWKTVMKAR